MVPNALFLLSLLISTLIAFATMALVVESLFVLFKIRQGRVGALLRMVPLLALLLDLILNSCGIGHWLNPLNCHSCVQKLLLKLFFPELKAYLYSNEFSLLNYLGQKVSPSLLSLFFFLFWSATLYFISRLLFELLIVIKGLYPMMRSEKICLRPIINQMLASALKRANVKLFTNDTFDSPMASCFRAIFIPNHIVHTFPQKEFEAIIAHELEHLLWKDPMSRLLTQAFSTLFWWIPMHVWQKKIEFDQEVACDRSIVKYGFEEEFLASGLVKVARFSKERAHKALCFLIYEKHPLLRRIQLLFNLTSIYSASDKWVSYIVIVVGVMIGSACLSWT